MQQQLQQQQQQEQQQHQQQEEEEQQKPIYSGIIACFDPSTNIGKIALNETDISFVFSVNDIDD